MEQAREQSAPREIAQPAEEDDDVVVRDEGAVRARHAWEYEAPGEEELHAYLPPAAPDQARATSLTTTSAWPTSAASSALRRPRFTGHLVGERGDHGMVA